MKSFGAKVKEQRGNLGLSQKQLAEKAGMGIRTITSYELGERKPYQAQLYKLAKALEVSTEYLQNDNIEDPSYGLDRMEYVEAVSYTHLDVYKRQVYRVTLLIAITQCNNLSFSNEALSINNVNRFDNSLLFQMQYLQLTKIQ